LQFKSRGARYGQPARGQPIKITIRADRADGMRLVIEDNGFGVEIRSGQSADSDNTSSGQGLALHGTLMAVISGTLALESEPRQHKRVVLSLPLRA
jgi:signal transduction histidine kinase